MRNRTSHSCIRYSYFFTDTSINPLNMKHVFVMLILFITFVIAIFITEGLINLFKHLALKTKEKMKK